jgi:DNA-binding MarR family transcriptional regulator
MDMFGRTKTPHRHHLLELQQRAFPDGSAAATEAVLNILKTATLLTASLAPLTRAHGLSLAAFNVLEVLASGGEPLPPRTISRRLLVPAQTLTSILDGLERAALIRRMAHPHDHRSILVGITEAGRTRLHETCVPVVLDEKDCLSCLAPAEQETLIGLLGTIQRHLSKRRQ